MINENVPQIDIKEILYKKAPSAAKKVPEFLINYLKRTIHQDEINYILREYKDLDGVDFMKALIKYFGITINPNGLENIPTDKRYIFASNHPLGGLDGICLSALIGEKFDNNILYLVNDLLLFIPNLQSIFIPINKHGAQSKRNATLIDNAYSSDKQILTFPAGLCSRKENGVISDLEWKKSFIQKSVEYKRDIVPVFFEGKNSNFFYNIDKLRKFVGIKFNVAMIYLPDEMFCSKQKVFNVYFGKPIPWQTFDKTRKADEWAKEGRNIVYNLKAK